jgi:hypothetical protein
VPGSSNGRCSGRTGFHVIIKSPQRLSLAELTQPGSATYEAVLRCRRLPRTHRGSAGRVPSVCSHVAEPQIKDFRNPGRRLDVPGQCGKGDGRARTIAARWLMAIQTPRQSWRSVAPSFSTQASAAQLTNGERVGRRDRADWRAVA